MYNIIVILYLHNLLATVIAGNVCSIQREDEVAGQDYTHICLVDETENNSTIIYLTLWKKNNISLKDIHSDILFFSSLNNISDAGYYSCEVEVSTMHSAKTYDEERNNTWLLQVKCVFECYTSVNK